MQREKVMKVLDDPLAQKLLHSPLLARLAYNGTDGFPRVIPVGYHWDGERVIVCTAANAPKVQALRVNPKVALTIDTDTQPPHVLLVRGSAAVEIVDGVPTEYLGASWKSLPAEQRATFEAQARSLYKQMARIVVVPEWAKLLDFETRFPVAVQALVGGNP
jgi:hypothetical protein